MICHEAAKKSVMKSPKICQASAPKLIRSSQVSAPKLPSVCPEAAKYLPQIYDETRRPVICVGSCAYSICEECKGEKEKCPICNKDSQFTINYNAVELLESIRNSLTQENYSEFFNNLKPLDQEQCSQCQKSTRILRICATCGESSKILVPNHDGSWNLSNSDSLEIIFLRAKTISICSDCALEDPHEGHKIITFHSVKGFQTKLQQLFELLAFGGLYDQKMRKEERKCEYLWNTVDTLRNMCHQLDLWKKIDGREHLKSDIMFEGPIPDAMLSEKKNASFQKALQIFERNEMLRDRIRLYHLENAKLYLDFSTEKLKMTEMEEEESSGERAKWQDTTDQLRRVVDRLKQLVVTELTDLEIEEIDTELDARMTEIENAQIRNSRRKLPTDISHFFKYRALAQEMREARQHTQNVVQQVISCSNELFDLGTSHDLKRLQIREEDCDDHAMKTVRLLYLEELTKFLNAEYVEKSLEVDDSICKRMQASYRELQCQLLRLRFFSKVPGSSYEIDIYDQLIDEVDHEDEEEGKWPRIKTQ
uniref:RING-type domain-containing protein n=1 Tax=Caenorhabditis japonica TaxID=281687 RepID=A0A8R1HQN9_CAEJA